MVMESRYKQTEVGVIPEDWEVEKLKEIATIVTGNTPPTHDRSNYGDEYLFAGPGDLGEGKWILDTAKKLSKKGFDISRKFPRNSILFTCIGSTIGKTGIASKELTSNQQINAVLPSKEFSSDYLYYSLYMLAPIIKACASEQAVPIINKAEFGETLIPFPPTFVEQTAIATALSDADELIQALEKLIAKKRLIKQGAMQELLKPKAGWREQELGKVLSSTQLGGNYPNTEKETDNPLIKMGNLGRGNIVLEKIEYIRYDTVPEKKDKLCVGDVLFNTRNTLDLVGKVSIWMGELSKAYFNSNILKLDFDATKVASNYFMNYVLNTKLVLEKFRSIATGTTSVAAIYTRDLMKVNLAIPGPDEQRRIAVILSDMDAELATLEAKLDKYRQIKQGMMQELLTGRIRLV